MASEVSIANLALSHLGDAATVASLDPPEGSAQAEHCAQFYPIARNVLLELHNWKFATRRASLALLTEPSWNWAFAYAPPNGAIKLLAVLPEGASSTDDSQDYEVESAESGVDLILTNTENATLRYIALITDTTKFPPLFIDALAWLLASYIAGPVLKGDAGAAAAKAAYQTFLVSFSKAKVSDANQRQVHPEHTPDWIGNR